MFFEETAFQIHFFSVHSGILPAAAIKWHAVGQKCATFSSSEGDLSCHMFSPPMISQVSQDLLTLLLVLYDIYVFSALSTLAELMVTHSLILYV